MQLRIARQVHGRVREPVVRPEDAAAAVDEGIDRAMTPRALIGVIPTSTAVPPSGRLAIREPNQ